MSRTIQFSVPITFAEAGDEIVFVPDYRELLIKYMEHVYGQEGTYFLGSLHGSEFDKKELELIADAANERAFGQS